MDIGYHIYRAIRNLIVTIVLGTVVLFSLLYLLLVVPGVQDGIKNIGEEELSKLLHTPVKIGNVNIKPFNRLALDDVLLTTERGDTILSVGEIGAGVSIYNLITKQRLVFTFAEIIDIDARLWCDSVGAPLNIQPIIDALSSKDKKKEPAKFDVKIHNTVIRRGRFSYDVLNAPIIEGKLDKNHISVENFTADIYFPRIKNNDFNVNVKRLALREKSGFRLDKFTANIAVNDTMASLRGFRIEMPNSVIHTEDIEFRYNGIANIKNALPSTPIILRIPNCYIAPSDLACLNPTLTGINQRLMLTLAAEGTPNNLRIPVLKIASENELLDVSLAGNINGAMDGNLQFSFPYFQIKALGSQALAIATKFAHISDKAKAIINNAHHIKLNGSLSGTSSLVRYWGEVFTNTGNIKMNASARLDKSHHPRWIAGHVATSNFNLGKLLGNSNLGELALDINTDITIKGKSLSGTLNGNVPHFDFKGYRYHDISADLSLDKTHGEGKIYIGDKNAKIIADGAVDIDGSHSALDIDIDVSDVNFAKTNLWNKFPDSKLSFTAAINLNGNNIDNLNGSFCLNDLRYDTWDNAPNLLDSLSLTINNADSLRTISLRSDIINGDVKGQYSFNTIGKEFQSIFHSIFPSLMPNAPSEIEHWKNDFTFNFNIAPDNRILELFNSKYKIADHISIVGAINTTTQSCWANINAPYLVQNNKKIIEATGLQLTIDGEQNVCSLAARTKMPNKKGPMLAEVTLNGVNDRLDAALEWTISNEHNYSGEVNLSAGISRDETNNLAAVVNINPSQVSVNDTIWTVNPTRIAYSGKRIDVDKLEVVCDKQFIKIDGSVSDNPNEQLNLSLRDIDLDYIFETLAIGNVTFGGRATGEFTASSLLSKAPIISTPGLNVKGFKYNNAPLGDAVIQSEWLNDKQGITLNADIAQANGDTSLVRGAIFPLADSLYLDFYCNRLDVRFLQPFMSAFTSKIGGYASGRGTLLGNFKRINFFGAIKPEDFSLKIDYLNTTYTTNDSIIIVPNDIALDNITITDRNGRTAKVNGHILHEDFRNAVFDIAITHAHELLCFDTNDLINPMWYGTIYGNGSAFIKGKPGSLNIDVNMSTAPSSKFTFVLSDSEAASDYDFISFTDRNAKPEVVDTIPDLIRSLLAKVEKNESSPSIFNLNLNVEATPQAQLFLVMDPVAGDRIRANGSGSLRLEYNSADDDITMLGRYTLEKGDYNFTLQDIIIKDFSIRSGSSISFDGNPLDAKLDISAIYQVNANLTDLDESFAQDKDMNRTNVPVHAVLNVTGDMTQPDVAFDLDFPTLSQDAIRKVKSIVNTDDMMNRQIIYLLALSRFYTPEYTGAQSQNNELASVASSTISSQLANILGQVSDNLSIAPNFRSNKGDFSDVEVDVALSSQLLNNRLLLNGNFGYRDKSLNANGSTFIGDFDIEYLLTKSGNIRLKAYNHYNDQNYYIKSALTTQGVGVMFKHDFNSLFDFIRPRRTAVPAPQDTIPDRPMR